MVCRASFQFHRHGSLRAPHMLGLYNTPKPHQKALKTPDPSSLKSPAKHRPALPTFRSVHKLQSVHAALGQQDDRAEISADELGARGA